MVSTKLSNMKTTPQLKRNLETNLRELQGMVNMSHSNQLTKKQMDDIARKQIVVEDIVKELKNRGVDTSKMLSKKYDIGGVVQAYSTPQMAGNLTGGSWGATLYELGGVVKRFTSPALLQFKKGGMLEDRAQDLVGKYVYLFTEGVETPKSYEIVNAKVASPNFRYRDLFFNLKNNDYTETIPSEKVEDFLNGKQVDIYNASKGEYYAFQIAPNQMSKGGKIKNQYAGKTAEQIWNLLSKEQREHFLHDHKDDIENYRGKEYGDLNSGEITKAYNSKWSELDKQIANRFSYHVKEGEYAEGGKIGFEGLAKKVARNYQGKKVDRKYRKEYGATYDKKEAMEVGRKVAAKVYRQQIEKMKNGGATATIPLSEIYEDLKGRDSMRTNQEVDEILTALIDAGITQKDLIPPLTKKGNRVSTSAWEKFKTKKTLELQEKMYSKYKGNLKGNQPFEIIYKLIHLSGRENPTPYLEIYKSYKMKRGGQAKVEILNENEAFDKDKYKAILDDFDMDGLPNVDDPEPLKVGKEKGTVEQVQLSKTFKKVLDVKQDLNIELNNFINKLRQTAPAESVIYGRTKTPYSILNKLVDSRLLDEKRGLKDLVGTTIAFDDIRDLQKFTEKTRKGFYGEVVDFDDFYSDPKDGYRAYHFIIKQNGVPIELQLKTKRMKDVNVLSHDAYKKKNLNTDFMLYLTTLADQADRGNKASQMEFSKLMQNKAQVENQLNN
jgi:hypothetical protein